MGLARLGDKLAPGAILAERYRIERVIGQGGMSTVYLAVDTRFSAVGGGRQCAVKEISEGYLAPEQRAEVQAAFEREAKLLATLQHPAIPKIYDYFVEDERVYLVLEYFAGSDLESVLNASPVCLTAAQVVQWAVQICEVLTYLHTCQPDPIIFRDIKPSNVLLVGDRIVLIDFGIARNFGPRGRGTGIGTEGYAPPEQYEGVADVRSDIYALAALMHHLLTNHDPQAAPPFSFSQFPISEVNPTVGSKLEQAIMRGLAYDRAERWPDVESFRQALLTASGVTETRSLRRTHVLQKNGSVIVLWRHDFEDAVSASATITRGILAVGSYDGTLVGLDPLTGQRCWTCPIGAPIPAAALPIDDLLVVATDSGEVLGIDSETGEGKWRTSVGGAVRASPSLGDIGVYLGTDDGMVLALDVTEGRIVWRFRIGSPIRAGILATEQYQYVASLDGFVYALDPRQPAERAIRWRRSVGRAIVATPAWDPEHDLIYVATLDGTLLALSTAAGIPSWEFRAQRAIASSPYLFDNCIYFGSADGHVYAVDASLGELRWKWPLGSQVAASPTISDGTVFIGGGDGCLYAIDLNGQPIWSYRTDKPIVSKALVRRCIAYVTSLDGSVYALQYYPKDERS